MCNMKDFKDLKMDNDHRTTLEQELDLWHRAYLPVGKTVLDIGAGNGETALFYLNHGAEHVICIEPNADLLYQNFGSDPRVTIVPMAIDSIKSDCEGAERNMVLETHFPFKLRFLYRFDANPHVALWKLREDWGNVFVKVLRKLRLHW